MGKLLHSTFVRIGLGVFILMLLAGAVFFIRETDKKVSSFSPTASSTLPVITLVELARHDGTDPSLPIYIGLDGSVYDVTLGKTFYATGGSYHDLAGKDSSAQLRFFGADIIKQKYPIIGVIGQ